MQRRALFSKAAFLFIGGLPLLAQEVPLSEAPLAELNHARSVALESARAAVAQVQDLTEGSPYSDENGILVAQGDSWFAYPFYNVLKLLEARHRFRVESVAHNGEWLDSMAYDVDQLSGLAHVFQRLHDQHLAPRAILLSGGGNDIAGPQLTFLLTHKRLGNPPLDDVLAKAVVERRLRTDMLALIAATSFLCHHYFDNPAIPIFIHGYGHPVPDGRGYGGGSWILPGPWLRPAFDTKGYDHSRADLEVATGAMAQLIDRYNEALKDVPALAKPANVHYISAISRLTNDLTGLKYRDDWGNELHPTKSGFKRIADLFAEELMKHSHK